MYENQREKLDKQNQAYESEIDRLNKQAVELQN